MKFAEGQGVLQDQVGSGGGGGVGQQLGLLGYCGPVGSAANIGSGDTGHLSGTGHSFGNVEIGDLLQRNQLATIFNQPLSDDIAASLSAIL